MKRAKRSFFKIRTYAQKVRFTDKKQNLKAKSHFEPECFQNTFSRITRKHFFSTSNMYLMKYRGFSGKPKIRPQIWEFYQRFPWTKFPRFTQTVKKYLKINTHAVGIFSILLNYSKLAIFKILINCSWEMNFQ